MCTAVVVACSHGLVGETEFFLFTSADDEGVISGSLAALQIVEVGREVAVAAKLGI